MRDRLIELISTDVECNKDGHGDCSMCEYRYADEKCAKYLSEIIADYLIANGVTVQEWISVKDRLPDKDEYVLCYSNKHGGYFFTGYRGWYTGEWMEGGCLHIGDVTHWMPMQQPPSVM